MDESIKLPSLNVIEIRVLGSLIEKSKTTPDYYPMTLNALMLACNQKSSRYPVVQYDEETVIIALNGLKKMGLTSTATGGTSRSVKYKHNLTLAYPLTSAELAVLCLLFLRGPLTAGEINSNSARLYEFESLDEIHTVLELLMSPEKGLIKQLSKRPGQKEVRYIHLIGEFVDLPDDEINEEPARKSVNEMEVRLAIVEQELAELKKFSGKIDERIDGLIRDGFFNYFLKKYGGSSLNNYSLRNFLYIKMYEKLFYMIKRQNGKGDYKSLG